MCGSPHPDLGVRACDHVVLWSLHLTAVLCAMLNGRREAFKTTFTLPFISCIKYPLPNMSPSFARKDSPVSDSKDSKNQRPRNIESINQVQWDASLQPKDYDIYGTHPDSKILFVGVNILDSTGREPYLGDVLIEGKSLCAYATITHAHNLRSTHHACREGSQVGRVDQGPKSSCIPWQRAHTDVRSWRRPHTFHLEWWRP